MIQINYNDGNDTEKQIMNLKSGHLNVVHNLTDSNIYIENIYGIDVTEEKVSSDTNIQYYIALNFASDLENYIYTNARNEVKLTRYLQRAKLFNSHTDAQIFIREHDIPGAVIKMYHNYSGYYYKNAVNNMYGAPRIDMRIKKVIFNDPATIVFWMDGTKTVVKNTDTYSSGRKKPFDPEKGLAMAIAKKALGNEGNYYETFKQYLPKEK